MLSVLVPTMPDRKSLLSRLLHTVLEQPGLNTEFEVIAYQSDGKTGDKINTMIDLALGSHVVVFDDDDWISARYMEKVLPLLAGRDSVGYDILQMVGGRFEARIRHDPMVSNGWAGETRGYCHKLPIRRSIALEIPFGNAYQDDAVWADAVEPGINQAGYVPEVLYFYDYQPVRHVGWWPHDPSEVRWL